MALSTHRQNWGLLAILEELFEIGRLMITHTVAFRLKHPKASPAEIAFLKDALALADIPGVQDFQRMHQVGTKADFDFGFSMRFADQAAYDGYNSHPVHVAFVQERWLPEVEAFIELDYVSLGEDG
jgi:hypothetical protein